MADAVCVRLVAYIRVSTDRNDDGPGARVQEQAVKAWARAGDHQIAAIHRDKGISGSNGVENRVALPAALEVVQSRHVGGLIVARLDRLARSLAVQEAILVKVWAMGGEVVTADDGLVLRDDSDDPMRTAMRQMSGVLAQLDQVLMTKRLREGKRSKAERGGYVGGRPPLGRRAVGGQLVVDDGERATVDRIRALREEGQSLRQIASALEAEGRATKQGGRWHPFTVGKIVNRLERPMASGVGA